MAVGLPGPGDYEFSNKTNHPLDPRNGPSNYLQDDEEDKAMENKENEKFPQAMWRDAVMNGETLQGYWSWVSFQDDLEDQQEIKEEE